MSASVNLPLHHKVQKFSSGTSSPGWSRKKGPVVPSTVMLSCAVGMHLHRQVHGNGQNLMLVKLLDQRSSKYIQVIMSGITLQDFIHIGPGISFPHMHDCVASSALTLLVGP